MVLHVCANTDLIIELICQTGAVGLSIEEKADLKRAAAIAHQQGVWVFGNLTTATTLFKGTPEEVYREAIAALENGTDFLCPGCGIAPPFAFGKYSPAQKGPGRLLQSRLALFSPLKKGRDLDSRPNMTFCPFGHNYF